MLLGQAGSEPTTDRVATETPMRSRRRVGGKVLAPHGEGRARVRHGLLAIRACDPLRDSEQPGGKRHVARVAVELPEDLLEDSLGQLLGRLASARATQREGVDTPQALFVDGGERLGVAKGRTLDESRVRGHQHVWYPAVSTIQIRSGLELKYPSSAWIRPVPTVSRSCPGATCHKGSVSEPDCPLILPMLRPDSSE